MIFLITMYQEYYFILSPVDSKAILAVIIEWYFDVRQAYIGEKNSIKMIKHDFYLFVFFKIIARCYWYKNKSCLQAIWIIQII